LNRLPPFNEVTMLSVLRATFCFSVGHQNAKQATDDGPALSLSLRQAADGSTAGCFFRCYTPLRSR
jgi:hypothetical protein